MESGDCEVPHYIIVPLFCAFQECFPHPFLQGSDSILMSLVQEPIEYVRQSRWMFQWSWVTLNCSEVRIIFILFHFCNPKSDYILLGFVASSLNSLLRKRGGIGVVAWHVIEGIVFQTNPDLDFIGSKRLRNNTKCVVDRAAALTKMLMLITS
jgi:hypothetical protein